MTDSVLVSLYFPHPMLEHIMQQARRLDRSMSWCVQKAWLHAMELGDEALAAASERSADRFAGNKVKQSLYFPVDMHEQIKTAAVRRDTSLSSCVQRAWCASIDKIDAMPSVLVADAD